MQDVRNLRMYRFSKLHSDFLRFHALKKAVQLLVYFRKWMSKKKYCSIQQCNSSPFFLHFQAAFYFRSYTPPPPPTARTHTHTVQTEDVVHPFPHLAATPLELPPQNEVCGPPKAEAPRAGASGATRILLSHRQRGQEDKRERKEQRGRE